MTNATAILISDFDGTMTRYDFYQLVVEQLLPAGTPHYWADFRAGRITHFEALAGYFAAIRSSEERVKQLIDSMEIDPHLSDSVQRLNQAGWQVVVASAGCRWYIDRLLAKAGVELEVHANPGSFLPGTGLKMRLPDGSPFLSRSHGIDKAAMVRHYLERAPLVAFAGDGIPDEPPARMVPPERRFARGDLARVLDRAGESYHPFTVWSDVVDLLVQGKSA